MRAAFLVPCIVLSGLLAWGGNCNAQSKPAVEKPAGTEARSKVDALTQTYLEDTRALDPQKDAKRLDSLYRIYLKNIQTLAGRLANADYLENVSSKIDSCDGCQQDYKMPMLVYDANCRRFFYTNRQGKPTSLNRLEDFKIYYKRPFLLRIINLNRYLYNVNLANSDVVFTSTQSEVMRQYLLPGSSDSAPAVPNTHADGSSASQGDQIFGLIANFKPELDRLFVALRGIPKSIKDLAVKQKTTLAGSEILKSVVDADPAAKTDSKTISDITRFNNYNAQLDEIGRKLNVYEKKMVNADDATTKKNIYINDYAPTLNSFHQKAQSIVGEIENNRNPTYNKLRNSNNFALFKASVNALEKVPPALAVASEDIVVRQSRADTLEKYADILFRRFRLLENYYNQFIDDKIKAYSLGNQSFAPVADESTLTYSYFNSLLSGINDAYADLREKAAQPASTPEPPELPAAAAGKPAPAAAPKPAPRVPDIMKVTAADFTFDKNGKITGIKLDQGGDAAKADPPAPKAPDDNAALLEKIDSLGAQWFAFEKSVSPEFIMRRILFRRNLVAANMSYTSPPIYPYGDRMRLMLYIVASDSAKKNGVILDDMTTESLEFRVRKKTQFSFSAGTFAAFGDNMRTATAEFRQVPAEGANVVDANSPYKLLNTGKGSIPIGAAALANLTFPVANGFRLGPSIGVGVTVAPEVKVGYLGGLTASAGNYHQFHFTFGATAMTVNELKDNFKNSNALYTTVPAGSVYTQKVKPGFFFAFSYTVFNVKATSKTDDGLINGTRIMVK